MARRHRSLGERWDHLRDLLEFQLVVPADDPGRAEKIRKKNRSRAFAARALYLLAFAIAAAVWARYLVSHRVYRGYETVSSRNLTDNVSSYCLQDGKLLRFSQDGVSLLQTDLTVLWDRAVDISQPVAVSAGEVFAVYDRRGTRVGVYDASGELGGFGTELPIISARVSESGNVVAALESGDYTKLVYYTANGEVIAELAEDAAREGQIAAFAVSGDGKTIAVAYFETFDGRSGTRLVFYDFGPSGRERKDHIVDEKLFETALVPVLTYHDGHFLAVRDNGFSMFRGDGKEEAFASAEFSEEILSVVEGDGVTGFVFNGRDEEHRFRMELYGKGGQKTADFPVDIAYERVSISAGSVVFSNGTNLEVYGMDGFCNFSGHLEEGTVFDILKVGTNRYFVVTDLKAGLIRLTILK